MRRVWAIAVVGCVWAWSSGALTHLHEHTEPDHDHSHCLLHALLSTPSLAAGAAPPPAAPAPAVAVVPSLADQLISCPTITWFDSRGPPAS